jgi:hypothetical protein
MIEGSLDRVQNRMEVASPVKMGYLMHQTCWWMGLSFGMVPS